MQWLVLLEAERGRDAAPFDSASLRMLLDALADPAPAALHSDDRYALQLEVDAPDPSGAVLAAVRRWEAASRELGVPKWPLVRVEALTREEFEREVLDYERHAESERSWPAPAEPGQERAIEESLLRYAFLDPLTGLASESLFLDQLEHSLASDGALNQRCALLVLDLDRFAKANERLGRSGADSVLVSVAHRVASVVGRTNGLGRLGGDQFAAILKVVSGADASDIARRIVEAVAARIVVDGAYVNVTASVGVALEERGDTGEDLLARASKAVRTAQDEGGARYVVYSDDMEGADIGRLEAERDEIPAADTHGCLALLERLSSPVEGSATLEEAACVVLHGVCDHAGFPFGVLHLPDGEAQDDLRPAAFSTVGPPDRFAAFKDVAQNSPVRPGEGVAGLAVAHGTPVRVRDIASEPGLPVVHQAVAAGLRGALALPVVVDGRSVAVLEFFADKALECGDSTLQFLTTIGAHLAAVARRTRAEQARDRSDMRLRVLLEHSGMHVKILGADGKVLEQYPPNWPEEAEFPVGAVDYFHPDDLAVTLRTWAEVVESPGPLPALECRVRTADGSWRWVEVSMDNMLDVPEIRAIVTYGRDAGDRKRSEETARRCDARLREAQALGRLGTWYADLVTGEVEWSEGLYRIVGLQPGQVRPGFATLLALTHPDDVPTLEHGRRLVEDGIAQVFEFRVGDAGGAVRWISASASPVRDTTGRVVAIEGTAQDVTELRELEVALRGAQERLREVETAAGIASWHTDVATGSTVWSPALYGILGLDPGSVERSGLDVLLDAVHADDRRRVEMHVLHQRGDSVRARVVTPGGDVRWVRIRSSVTRESTGRVTGYLGVVREETSQVDENHRMAT